MISIEGRIARIELTLAAIFDKLPKFIKENLGKEVETSLDNMRKDALETMRLRRDTN